MPVIDWSEVAATYAGINVDPGERKNSDVFQMYDVDSKLIWDVTKCVKKGYFFENAGKFLYNPVPVLYNPFPVAFKSTERTPPSGENVCYVCMVNKADAEFTECGNSGICSDCADTIIRSHHRTCPLCRKTVTAYKPMTTPISK
jgi:hypothetical protein